MAGKAGTQPRRVRYAEIEHGASMMRVKQSAREKTTENRVFAVTWKLQRRISMENKLNE